MPRQEWRIVALELLVPVIAFALIDHAVLGSSWAVRIWDRYRAPFTQTDALFVQGQLIHVRKGAQRRPRAERTLVVGSSSVVNGVDPAVASSACRQRGQKVEVVKFACTGMMAYELPLLADDMFRQKPATVIYLYNAFSFGDRPHPHTVETRWNTREFMRIASTKHYGDLGAERFCTAVAGELVFTSRYQSLLRKVSLDALAGKNVVNQREYDYDANEKSPERFPRPKVDPISPDNKMFWFRACYLESSTMTDTLGYRGLHRFLEMAASRGVRVVVAPLPEPEFSFHGVFKQGVEVSAIDRNVQEICTAHGVACLSREWVSDMEPADGYFRDEVHVNGRGRQELSRRLSEVVARFASAE